MAGVAGLAARLSGEILMYSRQRTRIKNESALVFQSKTETRHQCNAHGRYRDGDARPDAANGSRRLTGALLVRALTVRLRTFCTDAIGP